MLRDQGYENVHTFCHNLEDEVDLEISQRVASDLDYSWQEMSHSQEELDGVRQGEEWLSLREDIGGYGTLHPSSRHLLTFDKATNEFDEDSDFVLLRGDHAAAPGVFMPEFFRSVSNLTDNTAINTIFDYHYNLCLWNRQKYRHIFRDRILESVPHYDMCLDDKITNLIEYWYWRERTPNRLLPHQIVLHKNKISSWYPLWDKEFVKAMSSIPFQYRLNKELYKDYVQKKYEKSVGSWEMTDDDQAEKSIVRVLEHVFGRYLVGTVLENPMRTFRNKIRSLFSDHKCELNHIDDADIDICEARSAHRRARWILQNRQHKFT